MLKDIKKLIEKTPPTRDRYVDFLRAFSIFTVVIGHWLSAIVEYDPEKDIFRLFNAVGVTPFGWAFTWIFQVMPVFFFVGGFSNMAAFESHIKKGKSVSEFLHKRFIRLFRPTFLFLIIWFCGYLIFKIGIWTHIPLSKNILILKKLWIYTLQPLWFLGIYILIVLMSPFFIKIHKKYRFEFIIFLITLIAFTDLLRFGVKIPGIGWANFFLIWIFAHQLGFFYKDGSLVNAPKRVHFFLTFAGLGGLLILTNIGIYPKSMVGTGFDEISNMSPPTVCIVFLTLWQVGLIMLLRNALTKWLKKEIPWMLTILFNFRIMSIYLWSQVSFFITFSILYPFGFGKENFTVKWWYERSLWILLPSFFLIFFVLTLGKFERKAAHSS